MKGHLLNERPERARAAVAEWLASRDQPKFRSQQILEHVFHRRVMEPQKMSNLPAELRSQLSSELLAPPLKRISTLQSVDGTRKYGFRLADGALIESVWIPTSGRGTLCVSSQAGCPAGCTFCATAAGGFRRNLAPSEIVAQWLAVVDDLEDLNRSEGITQLVFMGMGESLANVDPVFGALHRIHDDIGIGARHMTVSTVGIVPGIRRFAELGMQVGLAVSLHAATDTKRNKLVPINKTYPLDELARACHDYTRASNRRISLEWAMISGTNDTPKDAEELAAYAIPLRAHVNLIPLNPTPGWPTVGSAPSIVDAFRSDLESRGVNVTVRQNRGTDIDAACGQLKADQLIASPNRRKRS